MITIYKEHVRSRVWREKHGADVPGLFIETDLLRYMIERTDLVGAPQPCVDLEDLRRQTTFSYAVG